MEKRLRGTVSQGNKTFVFELQAFLAKNQESLLMEVVDFYQKWKEIPVFPHYEFEIISLPKEAETTHLHIHNVGDRKFVCWTGRIPDYTEAEAVLKPWFLGSVYTILTGIPFENYLQNDKVKNNSAAFANELLKEFGLKLEFTYF